MRNHMLQRGFNLFLVEDNEADRLFVELSAKKSSLDILVHGHDGSDDTLQFVARSGRYSKLPKADMYLLDYHLPRHNYATLVATIRALADCALTPIILCSGTLPDPDLNEPEKYNQAMKLLGDIDAFITKPITRDAIENLCLISKKLAA